MKGILVKSNKLFLRGINKTYINDVVIYKIPKGTVFYFIKKALLKDNVDKIALSSDFKKEKFKNFKMVKKEEIYRKFLDEIILKYAQIKGFEKVTIGVMAKGDISYLKKLSKIADIIKYIHIFTDNKEKYNDFSNEFLNETGVSVLISEKIKREKFNIMINDNANISMVKCNLLINLSADNKIIFPNQLKEIILDIPEEFANYNLKSEEYSYIFHDFMKIKGIIT